MAKKQKPINPKLTMGMRELIAMREKEKKDKENAGKQD